jgi:transcriptional regulator with XRE-family HTH domain
LQQRWHQLLQNQKAARDAASLMLADISARYGIDQPALSRLEKGHTPNPTLDTLWPYASALGKRLVLTAEDVAETRGRWACGGEENGTEEGEESVSASERER